MKFKNSLIVLLLFVLCVGCASAISAADVDLDNGALTEQIADVDSADDNGEVLSLNQDETVVEQTENDKLADDAPAQDPQLSPAEKFAKDINDNAGTIYLTDNIKITEPFVIKNKAVIDGQGHTIDAQHKTYIFKARAPLTLKNIILKNGKSDKGGAIASNGDLTLVNCQFINNAATASGGAIFVKGNINIQNCKFSGNTAVESAGAVAVTYGHLTCTGSVFEKNSVKSSKSSGYGGAIWIHKSSSKITKTSFKSNQCISKSLKNHKKATKYKFNGGAISYSVGSTHSLSGCKFTSNKASNHGGSIFAYQSNSIKIDKCEFSKNRAVYEDGGAISFTAKKLTITNSNFHNNLAYEDGGALDSYSITGKKIYITVKNTKFTSNTAYKCGGAIWMGVKTVYKVTGSKFIKNKASSAGAIECEDGSTKIVKCTFKSNKAAKVTSWTVKTKSGARLSHSGGAILVKNKCTVQKSTFKGNKAKYGKSVKVEGGKLKSKGNKGIK